MIRLNQDNPYASGSVFRYNTEEISLERNAVKYVPTTEDSIHTVSVDETLWSISFKAYKTSKWWWLIYELNEALIPNPFFISPGIDLLIPDLIAVKLQNP
jgi:nucleoid-associated protein YgaU